MLHELFAIMRKQNTASEFTKHWREMTAWQHEYRAQQRHAQKGPAQ